MSQLKTLSVVILLTAGCQYVPGSTAALERESRGLLDQVLNDAPSARLQSIRATTVKGSRILCGLVNAKNRMGAYAGWRRFVADRNGGFTVISPDAADDDQSRAISEQAGFESIYPKTCASSGYAPAGKVAEAVAANT